MQLNIQHTINQQTTTMGQHLLKGHHNANKALTFSINMCISEETKIIGLYGPSGAGKSTILKILAGLVPKATYSIQWAAKEHSNETSNQNPCVYVGEDTQLFTHINLLDNLKLVIKQSASHSQSSFSIDEVISLCNLTELVRKMPWQLSTGEKQRSCFARALLSGKKILLLDEAFSALDWTKRMAFNRLLKEVVQQHGYLVFMVSHSLRELSLCVTTIITVNSGQITEQANLADALKSKLANKDSEQEHYFSIICATYSHIDKQDSALQVWNLAHTNANLSGAQRLNVIYVKGQNTQKRCSDTLLHNVDLDNACKTQTFVLDANKVSISKSEHHQTSMVNCLPIVVQDIIHINSGVVVCGKWQTQVLRSVITIKSYKQLNICVGDAMFFVFKAL